MTGPPQKRRAPQGRQTKGAQGRTERRNSSPSAEFAAVLAELARVQRDPRLTPLRRAAAILTLERAKAALAEGAL
jgi:hypothetical protein